MKRRARAMATLEEFLRSTKSFTSANSGTVKLLKRELRRVQTAKIAIYIKKTLRQSLQQP